jgi:hypothetical protein
MTHIRTLQRRSRSKGMKLGYAEQRMTRWMLAALVVLTAQLLLGGCAQNQAGSGSVTMYGTVDTGVTLKK